MRRERLGSLPRRGPSQPIERSHPIAPGSRRGCLAADAFVHIQDLPETDLLLAADYPAHEAGAAAAAREPRRADRFALSSRCDQAGCAARADR